MTFCTSNEQIQNNYLLARVDKGEYVTTYTKNCSYIVHKLHHTHVTKLVLLIVVEHLVL